MAGEPALAVSSVGPFGPMTMAPSTDRSSSAARAAASSLTTVTSNASAPPTWATPALICSTAGAGPATASRMPLGPELTAMLTNSARMSESPAVMARTMATAFCASVRGPWPLPNVPCFACRGARTDGVRGIQVAGPAFEFGVPIRTFGAVSHI